MKKSQIIISILAAMAMMLCVLPCGAKTKIAVVGNSITYGAGIANREKNSFPAQLQAYLGDGYEVVNFGVSGRTLLSKGDYPYVATQEYADSKAFQPDIVLIKLGTNDSKPQNRKYFQEFAGDYQALIDSYRNLECKPEVILLTPVRCFLPAGSEIDSTFITDRVVPAVRQMAYDNCLDVVNLHNLFGNVWDAQMMPDRLHPSSIGAGVIAKQIGRYLESRTSVVPGLPKVVKKGREFNFYGYKGYDFKLDGMDCKIVLPRHEAKGKPWVLRARFWGHQPQADIALLERGFHIAYCDVADLYGAPEATRRWDKFYKQLVKAGFSKKVVLEGMSRGGPIVYNWAMANPDKVACIYADAPVMDLTSWPGGFGTGKGSKEDTDRMMQVYGFNTLGELKSYSGRHIDRIAGAMAKARIPAVHVVGDADEVVPYAENTKLLEEALDRNGWPLTVIHKPGIGHHPHSLDNPAPIVDFILKSTVGRDNECTHAVPGNEFRSGAGWAQGNEWHSVADDIQATLNGRKLDLLLLGNSITQGWGGNRKAVTYKPGKGVMDELYGAGRWESAGISGDSTQNLLWRLRNYDYNVCRPEHVVIAIGVNNIVVGENDADDIAEGIIAVAEEAEKVFPESDLILLGLYPTGKDKNGVARRKYNRIHELLGTHNFGRVRYVNPTDWFVDTDGNIRDGLYGGDYIHFTPEGYRTATTHILQLIGEP